MDYVIYDSEVLYSTTEVRFAFVCAVLVLAHCNPLAKQHQPLPNLYVKSHSASRALPYCRSFTCLLFSTLRLLNSCSYHLLYYWRRAFTEDPSPSSLSANFSGPPLDTRPFLSALSTAER